MYKNPFENQSGHISWREVRKAEDATRIKELVGHSQYKKIPANHVIHAFKPKEFIQAVENFSKSIKNEH